jgi:hypothetical protein
VAQVKAAEQAAVLADLFRDAGFEVDGPQKREPTDVFQQLYRMVLYPRSGRSPYTWSALWVMVPTVFHRGRSHALERAPVQNALPYIRVESTLIKMGKEIKEILEALGYQISNEGRRRHGHGWEHGFEARWASR